MSEKITGLYKRGQVYWYAWQINGRRVFISLDTRDYSEAVQKILEIRSKPELSDSGQWDWEVQNYVQLALSQGTLSKAYARSRRNVLLKFGKDYQIHHPRQVNPKLLQEWHDKLKQQSHRTAQHYLFCVQAFFKHLISQGKMVSNPAKYVSTDKVMLSARKDFLPASFVSQLISECKDPDLKFILLCGFDAGLRKIEIIEARPGWFHLDRGSLTIQKTETFQPKDRDERTIPLTSRFKDFLKIYGFKHPFMLRPEIEHGQHVYRYDFRKLFNSYMKQKKFSHITAHDMRRSFASNLVIAGVSVFKVAVWLGDGVEVVQKHYAHLLPMDNDIERGVSTEGILSQPQVDE